MSTPGPSGPSGPKTSAPVRRPRPAGYLLLALCAAPLLMVAWTNRPVARAADKADDAEKFAPAEAGEPGRNGADDQPELQTPPRPRESETHKPRPVTQPSADARWEEVQEFMREH